MSVDKYPFIFSRQMEAIVYFTLLLFNLNLKQNMLGLRVYKRVYKLLTGMAVRQVTSPDFSGAGRER